MTSFIFLRYVRRHSLYGAADEANKDFGLKRANPGESRVRKATGLRVAT